MSENSFGSTALRGVFRASALAAAVLSYAACDFDYTPRNAEEGTGPFLKIDIQKDNGKTAGIAALTALGTGLVLSARRKEKPQP